MVLKFHQLHCGHPIGALTYRGNTKQQPNFDFNVTIWRHTWQLFWKNIWILIHSLHILALLSF
jgi:hypothetical protein